MNNLDEDRERLARILPESSSDEMDYEGLCLMERMSETDEGLAALYSLCVANREPSTMNALSFILARTSTTRRTLVGDLFFDFVEKFDSSWKYQAVLNTLSAIESLYASANSWGQNPAPPPSLFTLLEAGLFWSGTMDLLLHDAARSLLLVLCDEGEITRFTDAQKEVFRDRVIALAGDSSDEETVILVNCLSAS